MVNTLHSLQSYYSLTSTYRCLRVCSSELVRILCQHPLPRIWLSILSWPEAGWSAKDQQVNQLRGHSLNPTSCLQRYNKFQSLLSQKTFRNPTKQKTLLLKTEICSLWSPSKKNLCGKIASTLLQNRRPVWDRQSVHSGYDVTALSLSDSPCAVVNHSKLGFDGA